MFFLVSVLCCAADSAYVGYIPKFREDELIRINPKSVRMGLNVQQVGNFTTDEIKEIMSGAFVSSEGSSFSGDQKLVKLIRQSPRIGSVTS